MINDRIKKIQLLVTICAIILGTILHFTYEMSQGNKIVGLFSAVNESVWEHLKLVFFPMFLFGIIEYFIIRKITNNYIEGKVIGISLSIIFIITFYYTYTGIIGKNFFILDILTFVFSIIIGEYIAYKIMIKPNKSTTLSIILSLIIIIILFISFVKFTYNAPNINIFKDPTQIKEKKS